MFVSGSAQESEDFQVFSIPTGHCALYSWSLGAY